jgi:serine/threonine protein kinase
MSVSLCPKCQTPNRLSARFCSSCGAPLMSGVSEAQPVPSDTVPLPAGTVLQGRYRIEGLLGKGGFGAVYRSWDLSLSRLCAVKENLDTSAEAQRQFAREATVLASLNHPNLPRVTDHFIISGQGQYLVMDYVEGEDVISIVEHRGLPAVEQSLDWLYQVMDALIYLHGRQPPVVHRDIKPANIRITSGDALHPYGKAMLVDFGLVKASDPHTKTTLGARAVTPGYSPPEQYGQGHTDSRSDIYSLGATLYALLTGQDPPESVLRIGQDILRPADQINPNVAPAIAQVVVRAMSLSPTQRYQTVTNLKSDLQAATQAVSGYSTVHAQAQPVSEPTVMVSPPAVPPAGTYSPVAGPQFTAPAAPSTSSGTVAVSSVPSYPSQDQRVYTDQQAVATPHPTAKRNWTGIAAGVVVAGIVLAVIALLVIWNWMGQTSSDEMKKTVDAGVAATRTAWAKSTEGAMLAPEQIMNASLAATPQPASVYLYNSEVSDRFVLLGDIYPLDSTPIPAYIDYRLGVIYPPR